MRRWSRGGPLLISLLMVVSGCATPPAPVEPVDAKPVAVAVDTHEVEDWLHFADSARRYSASEFTRELELVRQAFLQEKSDWRRLQYSYMLLLPNHKQHDVLRALTLLEPLLRDGRGGVTEWRSLAGMLHAQALEQQRLEEALEQAQQKTREEQRRADTAEQRATQAMIKLDTLRSLEQNLYRRHNKDKY